MLSDFEDGDWGRQEDEGRREWGAMSWREEWDRKDPKWKAHMRQRALEERRRALEERRPKKKDGCFGSVMMVVMTAEVLWWILRLLSFS